MKSGFIGIIGRPNVGKSTLLNQMVGEKVAITTDKPQTTRNSIRGIYTRMPGMIDAVDAAGQNGEGTSAGAAKTAGGKIIDEGCQMVFIDTPGVHKGRNKLGQAMTEMAENTLNEVDAVIFIVDSYSEKGGDKYVFDLVKECDAPKILVINKIDIMEPDEYLKIYNYYDKAGVFDEIYGTSALTGKNVPDLMEHLESLLDDGPMYFPEDMITDYPERFLVTEIIREKTLMYLDEEVPHGIAVEIESYEETPKLTRIGCVIFCEKKSHKGIIIGKQGKKLKGIGKAAREELEALLGTKIYLELWVKVRENWRDSDRALLEFGYKEREQ